MAAETIRIPFSIFNDVRWKVECPEARGIWFSLLALCEEQGTFDYIPLAAKWDKADWVVAIGLDPFELKETTKLFWKSGLDVVIWRRFP